MRIEARAKINWTLDVLGVTENGYHELDMLMQPVSLSDKVCLEPAERLDLQVTGPFAVPADEHNLAWRAAKALQDATGCKAGASISVDKQIPTQAGMGGGSADAAAVLWGLNELWHTGLDGVTLEKIGLTLGADVPFCLHGGLCRAKGVGERLTRYDPAPRFPLCVVQPCTGLSTGSIFRAWHEEPKPMHVETEEALLALQTSQFTRLDSLLRNALQPVSMKQRPEIRLAIDALKAEGADAALMTGSGSAVFGVFSSEETAKHACGRMKEKWPVSFACESEKESLCVLSD